MSATYGHLTQLPTFSSATAPLMQSARGSSSRTRLTVRDESQPEGRRQTRSQARAATLAQGPEEQRSRTRHAGHRLQQMKEDAAHSSPVPRQQHRLSTLSRDSPMVSSPQHRRRIRVRKSLTHPNLRELDIEQRMSMLRSVAQDYIVKALRDSGEDDTDAEELERTWEGLQSAYLFHLSSHRGIREKFVFGEGATPFPNVDDIGNAIHPRHLKNISIEEVTYALRLSNIASFLRVILRPDAAVDLAEEDDAASHAKGKGRAEDQTRLHVRLRNSVMITAWKAFWDAVVPPSLRSSHEALDQWLEFATQIIVTYQCPSIDPALGPDPELPSTSQRDVGTLFAGTALSSRNSWMAAEHLDEEHQDLEETWKIVSHERSRVLEELSSRPAILRRRYPYDRFRTKMRQFVQDEILEGYLSSESESIKSDPETDNSSPESEENRPVYSDPPGSPIDIDFLRDLMTDMEPNELHEDEEGVGTRLSNVSAVSGERIPTLKGFDWRARQEGATMIDWDSEASDRDTPGQNLIARRPLAASDDGDDELLPSETQLNGGPETLVDDLAREELGLLQAETPTRLPGSVRRRGFDVNDEETDLLPSESQLHGFHPDDSEISEEDDLLPAESQLHGERSDDEEDDLLPSDTQLAGTGHVREEEDEDEDVDEEDDLLPAPSQLQGTHEPRRAEPDMSDDDLLPSAVQLEGGSRSEDSVESPTQLRTAGPHAPQFSRSSTSALQQGGDTSEPEVAALLSPSTSRDSQQRSPDNTPDRTQVSQRQPQSQAARTGPDSESDEDLELPPGFPASATRRPEPTADGVKDDGRSTSTASEDHAGGVAVPVQPTSQQAFRRRSFKRTDDSLAFASPESDDLHPVEKESPARAIPAVRLSGHRRPRPSRASLTQSPSVKHHIRQHVKPNVGSGYRPSQDPVEVSFHEELNYDESRSNASSSRSPQPRENVARARSAHSQARPAVDPFLVDEEGQFLRPDESYVVPSGHKPQPSVIHGRIGGQATTYSRLGGQRKWSLEEQILLYRTVQMVPLSVVYPLQVVWYLHGEFGKLSTQLEQYNTQHMKDKMRVIVQTRRTNRRPVVGRARFFLPTNDKDRLAFDEELSAYRDEEKRLRDAEAEEVRVEVERAKQRKEANVQAAKRMQDNSRQGERKREQQVLATQNRIRQTQLANQEDASDSGSGHDEETDDAEDDDPAGEEEEEIDGADAGRGAVEEPTARGPRRMIAHWATLPSNVDGDASSTCLAALSDFPPAEDIDDIVRRRKAERNKRPSRAKLMSRPARQSGDAQDEAHDQPQGEEQPAPDSQEDVESENEPAPPREQASSTPPTESDQSSDDEDNVSAAPVSSPRRTRSSRNVESPPLAKRTRRQQGRTTTTAGNDPPLPAARITRSRNSQAGGTPASSQQTTNTATRTRSTRQSGPAPDARQKRRRSEDTVELALQRRRTRARPRIVSPAPETDGSEGEQAESDGDLAPVPEEDESVDQQPETSIIDSEGSQSFAEESNEATSLYVRKEMVKRRVLGMK